MIAYLDTSVVLRFLLNQPPLLAQWDQWEIAYTSELCGVEARRAFDRLRLDGVLDDEGLATAHDELHALEDELGIIALSRGVLQRAALPMPTPVRTLDALHLATALIYRENRDQALMFATHDDGQALAARSLGFALLT